MSSPSEPQSEKDFASMLAQSRAGYCEIKGRLLIRYTKRLEQAAEAQLPRESVGRMSAEDFVQETLVRAYQCFDQFTGSSEPEFSAWLHAIVHRTILGEARRLDRQKHEPGRQVPLDAVLPGHADVSIAAPESSGLKELIAQENRAQIETCLLELSAIYREVFRLRAMENRSYADIGAILGISAGTAQVRFLRAAHQLRQLLEKKGFGTD